MGAADVSRRHSHTRVARSFADGRLAAQHLHPIKHTHTPPPSRSVISKAKAAASLAGSSKSANSTVEDLLDAVVAPRSYAKDDGSVFLQRISSGPATKTDVVRLQESLDQLLQQRQARETGICPVREALYSEAFGACAVRESRARA